MDKVIQNLKNMEKWIAANLRRPAKFKTHYDFMRLAVEVMNRCLYLLKLGVYSTPDAETANVGYAQPKAIIVGHLVRLTKLYEGALIHISERQVELARIFFRLILETTIKMKYLIKAKEPTFRNFILDSYRPEWEMLQHLEAVAKTRPLKSIEKRMTQSIKSRMRKEGISESELTSHKQRGIDGKNFRQLCEDLGDDGILYLYGYRESSYYVHGDWQDIQAYHLAKEADRYVPSLSFNDSDPRLACPLTQICLDILLAYLEWNKSDPHDVMTPVIAKLRELNASLDEAHESWFGEEYQ